MRKQCMRILIALIGIAGLGVAARGQEAEIIVVNIPYDFVVPGKTLPAGIYRVNRASSSNEEVLVLSSFENRASVVVVATVVEGNKTGKASVSFEQVGGEHFLSKIETAGHLYSISVSRSEILEAAARSHGGTSAAGSSSGSN